MASLHDLTIFDNVTMEIAKKPLKYATNGTTDNWDFHLHADLGTIVKRSKDFRHLPRKMYGLDELDQLHDTYCKEKNDPKPVEPVAGRPKTVNIGCLKIKYAKLPGMPISDSEFTESEVESEQEPEVLRRHSELLPSEPEPLDMTIESIAPEQKYDVSIRTSPLLQRTMPSLHDVIIFDNDTNVTTVPVSDLQLAPSRSPHVSIRTSPLLQRTVASLQDLTIFDNVTMDIAKKPLKYATNGTTDDVLGHQSEPLPSESGTLDMTVESIALGNVIAEEQNVRRLRQSTSGMSACGRGEVVHTDCNVSPNETKERNHEMEMLPNEHTSIGNLVVSTKTKETYFPVLANSEGLQNGTENATMSDSPAAGHEVIFDYASTASPRSRRASRLSTIPLPQSSRRCSIHVGLQPQHTYHEVIPKDPELRVAKGRSSMGLQRRSQNVADVSLLLGLQQAILGPNGAFQCEIDGRKFELVVQESVEVEERMKGVQCTPADIDADMDILFALIVPYPDLEVQKKKKFEAAIQWNGFDDSPVQNQEPDAEDRCVRSVGVHSNGRLNLENSVTGQLMEGTGISQEVFVRQQVRKPVVQPVIAGKAALEQGHVADACGDLQVECDGVLEVRQSNSVSHLQEETSRVQGESSRDRSKILRVSDRLRRSKRISVKSSQTRGTAPAGVSRLSTQEKHFRSSNQPSTFEGSTVVVQATMPMQIEGNTIIEEENLKSGGVEESAASVPIEVAFGQLFDQESTASAPIEVTREHLTENEHLDDVVDTQRVYSANKLTQEQECHISGDRKATAVAEVASNDSEIRSSQQEADDNNDFLPAVPDDDYSDIIEDDNAAEETADREDGVVDITTGEDVYIDHAVLDDFASAGHDKSSRGTSQISPPQRSVVFITNAVDIVPQKSPENDVRKVDNMSKKRKMKSISKKGRKTGTGTGRQTISQREQKRLGLSSLSMPPDGGLTDEEEMDSPQIRRSKRRKFPPLQFWRNEKKVYERRRSQLLPTISRVLIAVDRHSEDESGVSCEAIKKGKVVPRR